MRVGHAAWLSDQSGAMQGNGGSMAACGIRALARKTHRNEEDRIAHTYPLRHKGSTDTHDRGATPAISQVETVGVTASGVLDSSALGTGHHNALTKGLQ
jgi:hypothetical protein